MIIEKIGCYEISKIIEKGEDVYIVDNGKYLFSKRTNKFRINKKHKIVKFKTFIEAKEYCKKKVKVFIKKKNNRIKKLPKSLYLVLLKEKKTKITFVKVGFTSKKFIIRRFSKEHGYEDYELLEVLRRVESPKSEQLEDDIKKELKSRNIKKYRPILESFSGYSECFDIENLEIIKSIFDGKVNLNEGNVQSYP
jgi:hypothetical protein